MVTSGKTWKDNSLIYFRLFFQTHLKLPTPLTP